VLLILKESSSYKINYIHFRANSETARIFLIPLVGAAGFEPATPCAQGGFRQKSEMTCNQVLTFRSDARRRVVR